MEEYTKELNSLIAQNLMVFTMQYFRSVFVPHQPVPIGRIHHNPHATKPIVNPETNKQTNKQTNMNNYE